MNFDILHLGKYYFPHMGGIEYVNKVIMDSCPDLVQCTISFNSERNARQVSKNGNLVISCKTQCVIKSQPISLFYLWYALCFVKRSKIIHFHSPNFLAALSLLFISRNTKLIIHWHGDVVNKGLFSTLLRPLEMWCLSRADKIICTSPVIQAQSPQVSKFKNKVVVIPIGIYDYSKIEVTLNNHIDHHLEDFYANLNGKKIVLAVGRQVHFKGFDVIIRAAELVSDDFIFCIVGDGPLLAHHRDLVAIKGLSSKVFFVGGLDPISSKSHLLYIFSISHAYCLPSILRSESFGIVLIEAMSFSLPVLCSDLEGSGVGWVSPNGLTGRSFTTSSPLSLANTLSHLFANEQELSSFRSNARNRYLSEFSYEVFVERIKTLYCEILYE